MVTGRDTTLQIVTERSVQTATALSSTCHAYTCTHGHVAGTLRVSLVPVNPLLVASNWRWRDAALHTSICLNL